MQRKRRRKEGVSLGSHRLLVYCRKHSGLSGSGGGGGRQRRPQQPPQQQQERADSTGADAGVASEALPGTGQATSASRTASGVLAQPPQGARAAATPAAGWTPPANPAGAARCLVYDFALRRGQRAPEAMAAAKAKRLFVRATPYLVGGPKQQLPAAVPPSCCTHHPPGWRARQATGEADVSAAEAAQEQAHQQAAAADMPSGRLPLGGSADDGGLVVAAAAAGPLSARATLSHASPCLAGGLPAVASLAERYAAMRATVGRRVTAGKSGIHGWGAFAKTPHRAGDMVIE